MEYTVVELPQRRLVGVGVHTGNQRPDMAESIGRLWGEFLRPGGHRDLLDPVPGSPCFGVYTNYKWDTMEYDVLTACEARSCPPGFQEILLPAGKYAKFSFRGEVRSATGKAWEEIWAMDTLPRACLVDFEEYGPPDANGIADIHIYIGLADICQSCGMPMTVPEQHGTQADGSSSPDYCVYCCQNGNFTAQCSMEEMIDFCLNCEAGKQLYQDQELARKQMREYFSTLKRWKA